jgi:hypothetical protein
MNFDVYCDESYPDLFSSEKSQAQYLVIGSLWIESSNREAFKDYIHDLCRKHRVGGEFKWQKVSPSRFDFYVELIDFFFAQNDLMRFRCIAVDKNKVDLLRFHDCDQELGFYKFYYQMIQHWILDFNEYSIFCDYKSNRIRTRLHTLQKCLEHTNLSSKILAVQAVRSEESRLIQMVDILTGLAAASLNNNMNPGTAKQKIVSHLESHLGRRISHTLKSEQKFNVFIIDLKGGW